MINSPLLTIAIPTYNRGDYLDDLLESILTQDCNSLENVEIIICDNHSIDNTEEVCKKYLALHNDIVYVRNNKNIGMDGNFERCFNLAKGRFFWMIGDDDILRPNALPMIISLLNKENDYDVICINSSDSSVIEQQQILSVDEYESDIAFIGRIGIMFTFISGIICNKQNYQRLTDAKKLDFVYDTYLLQLFWQLPLIKAGRRFGYVNNNLIKSTSDNSGGYGLFTVFAKNLAFIVDLFYARNHPVSQGLRKSSAKFLLNFLHNKKKNSAFTVSNYLTDAHVAYNDLLVYKLILQFLYRHPNITFRVVKIRKFIKKLVPKK